VSDCACGNPPSVILKGIVLCAHCWLRVSLKRSPRRDVKRRLA
jgi:hypothetical protein